MESAASLNDFVKAAHSQTKSPLVTLLLSEDEDKDKMEPSKVSSPDAKTGAWSKKFRLWLVAATIVAMAFALIVLISGNWRTRAGERVEQATDDAYVRADLTPLSTKVAGLVASVEVANYQTVKAGDLLVRLRDEDFRAQAEQPRRLDIIYARPRRGGLVVVRRRQAARTLNTRDREAQRIPQYA
jgi:multidrug resistance efflux pump